MQGFLHMAYAVNTQSKCQTSNVDKIGDFCDVFFFFFFIILDNSDLFNYFCPESPDTYKRSNFQSQKFQLQLGLINIPS